MHYIPTYSSIMQNKIGLKLLIPLQQSNKMKHSNALNSQPWSYYIILYYYVYTTSYSILFQIIR